MPRPREASATVVTTGVRSHWRNALIRSFSTALYNAIWPLLLLGLSLKGSPCGVGLDNQETQRRTEAERHEQRAPAGVVIGNHDARRHHDKREAIVGRTNPVADVR